MTKTAAPISTGAYTVPRKLMLPHNPIARPCSSRALRQIFHDYGSPCKIDTSDELFKILTQDLKQILVIALGFTKNEKPTILES